MMVINMNDNMNSERQHKVLITATSLNPGYESDAMAALRQFTDELVFNETGKPLEGIDLVRKLDGCDGVIAGVDKYSGDVLSACAGCLKVISRYGSGVDNIDMAAARENGITVCNTPGANAQSVADLAIGLMLCAARRLPMLDRSTKTGEWQRTTGTELFHKTIGIIGLGAVGKGVARRAQGFSMRVLAYDIMPDYNFAQINGINVVTLEELLEASDFITLHLPLNVDTRCILDREALRLVKPNAILINTARGGLIDEAAVHEMLVSGRLGGLGLDVYENEPPGDSPLFKLDSVVATPHIASHTKEAIRNVTDISIRNLIDVLSGRHCRHTVD